MGSFWLLTSIKITCLQLHYLTPTLENTFRLRYTICSPSLPHSWVWSQSLIWVCLSLAGNSNLFLIRKRDVPKAFPMVVPYTFRYQYDPHFSVPKAQWPPCATLESLPHRWLPSHWELPQSHKNYGLQRVAVAFHRSFQGCWAMRWTPFLINFQTLEAQPKKESLVSRFQARLTTGSMPTYFQFQCQQLLISSFPRILVAGSKSHSRPHTAAPESCHAVENTVYWRNSAVTNATNHASRTCRPSKHGTWMGTQTNWDHGPRVCMVWWAEAHAAHKDSCHCPPTLACKT